MQAREGRTELSPLCVRWLAKYLAKMMINF
jgi:hypothetical protein